MTKYNFKQFKKKITIVFGCGGQRDKNKRLIKRLNEGEFKSNKLAIMEPQHTFPENWKILLDKKNKRDKLLYEVSCETYSSMFTCGICKKKKMYLLSITNKKCG